jgi:hypothetical protein
VYQRRELGVHPMGKHDYPRSIVPILYIFVNEKLSRLCETEARRQWERDWDGKREEKESPSLKGRSWGRRAWAVMLARGNSSSLTRQGPKGGGNPLSGVFGFSTSHVFGVEWLQVFRETLQ